MSGENSLRTVAVLRHDAIASKGSAATITQLAGGGEMAALIRAKDWSQTPLGPAEQWPVALRMMVSMLLANRFPMLLWWGPDYISIYNDSYRPILGSKHPWALGLPFRQCWSEIAHVIGPLIDAPFNGGPSTWMDDILLEINRHGFFEETHFTVAYSPVPDETAPRGIGGVLATVTEITEKIVGERRLVVLHDLAARSGEGKSAADACVIAATALKPHDKDIPFALLYLLDASRQRAMLAGAVGVEPGTAVAPHLIELDAARTSGWPLTQVLQNEQPLVIDNLYARLAEVPPGPWGEAPHTALALPVKSTMAHQSNAVLIAGVSARLRLDDQYRGFLELVAAQIGTAITNADAYEAERKRSDALAEIDRVKTTFFSNVSHEFRTPLTLMLGPIEEAVAHVATPPQIRTQLELAHRNSLRLLKLVNSLLDFSRIEAGRVQASYQPTDLAALTTDLASSFRSAMERAGLDFAVDCPALDQPVFVDREMWEKIVLNLLSNAFKFTFDGGINVRLRQDRDAAVLEVTDTGVGVPAVELPRLFERFHRVEGSRGRTQEGSGIGLALVQELVRLHGGSIDVHSELERGTTFRIRLPFGSAHLPAQHRRAAPVSNSSVATQAFVQEALRWIPREDGRTSSVLPMLTEIGTSSRDVGASSGARILLADDNADMRDYVAELLSATYEVEAVADGVQALESARRAPPDLVLSDVMMPRLDGLGLLRELRADDTLRHVPVILLSARAGEEARVDGLGRGADDYLVKPFSARELLARVNALLELTRMRRENEERFRAFLSATSDVIFRMSPDWSEMRHLMGRNLIADTDDPSRTWMERYIPEEDQQRVGAAIRAAIQTQSIYELEHRVRRLDGSIGWTFSRAIPIKNDAGEIVEWIGATTDVTERKLADRHLREREDALNRAHGELQARTAELARFNQAAVGRELRMIELKQEINALREDLGDTPRYTLNFEQPAPPPATALAADTTGAAPLESILLTGRLQSRPQRAADYALESRVLTALVQALADSPRTILQALVEQVLQALRAGSAVLSVFTPHADRCQWVAIAGEWSSHLGGGTPRGFGPCCDVLDGNAPLLFTHWERRYPYLAAATPLVEEALLVPLHVNGRAIGTLWVLAHDSQRRFDAEDLRLFERLGKFAAVAYQAVESLGALDQRRAALNLLEEAVQARRLAEESNRKLRESEEALRESDRRKTEFLALLGHELRNPLSPIGLASELLARTAGDDRRTRAAIQMIQRQTAQLTRLVDDLLDIGRITQGRIQLQQAPVELSAVIAQAIETVEPQLRQKHHDVSIVSSYGSVFVLGDFARLVQCVVNILANAAKYTEAHGRIRVETQADTSQAVIRITDNGAGLAPDLLPRVFDLFVQSERTLDRAEGGLGIGLSVVRKLIDMHGGEVSAHSDGLGRGSTFEIRLPRISAPAASHLPTAAVKAAPRRILIVDDNADAGNSLAMLLSEAGHHTEVALGSREALRMVEVLRPEIALVDIGLPDINGYELARALRATQHLQGLRLIAVTGYGQTEDREKTLAAGFDEHLVKPVDLDVLERILANRAD